MLPTGALAMATRRRMRFDTYTFVGAGLLKGFLSRTFELLRVLIFDCFTLSALFLSRHYLISSHLILYTTRNIHRQRRKLAL